MPVNKSSLRVYFIGRFRNKVVHEIVWLFTNLENDYLLKITKK